MAAKWPFIVLLNYEGLTAPFFSPIIKTFKGNSYEEKFFERSAGFMRHSVIRL
jgi:hypothetical protein